MHSGIRANRKTLLLIFLLKLSQTYQLSKVPLEFYFNQNKTQMFLAHDQQHLSRFCRSIENIICIFGKITVHLIRYENYYCAANASIFNIIPGMNWLKYFDFCLKEPAQLFKRVEPVPCRENIHNCEGQVDMLLNTINKRPWPEG